MVNANGKTTWVFPDLEMPPAGHSPLFGHESIIVLNMNDTGTTTHDVVFCRP